MGRKDVPSITITNITSEVRLGSHGLELTQVMNTPVRNATDKRVENKRTVLTSVTIFI